jgi:hypothetical protein
MISKMVIGGKKLGAATKNTIDKLGTGDKRTSGDIHYGTSSGEGYRGSPTLQQRLSREESAESPVVRSSGLSQERMDGEPELKDIAYGSQAVGLGVSTPTQATPMESEPRTSFGQMQLPAQRPESPYQPPRNLDQQLSSSVINSRQPRHLKERVTRPYSSQIQFLHLQWQSIKIIRHHHHITRFKTQTPFRYI